MTTPRIEISSSKFQVSKPGFDVTTSLSQADLLFDFLSGHYAGIALGPATILFTAAGWTSALSSFVMSNDTTTYTYNLAFGQTFAAPPPVLWGVSSAFLNSGDTFYEAYNPYLSNTTSSGGGFNFVQTSATISTTGIIFTIVSTYGTTGPSIGTRFEWRMNFIYTVLHI